MKKHISILLVIVLLTMMFTGCGKDKTSEDIKENEDIKVGITTILKSV